MSREKEILIPQYMKEFKCIGADCEDTCCAGWYVSIDEATYKKYKRVADYEMKKKIEKHVIRQRSNPTKDNVAKMKLIGGRCSFLTEEGWCEIHGKLGEEYLSNTCAIYPRYINKVNDIEECSLTVSCPEAARKILLHKELMAFDHTYQEIAQRTHIHKSVVANSKAPKSWEDYFWELRIFVITVLQSREYTIEERLFILGLFFEKLENVVGQGAWQEVPSLIVKYTDYLQNNLFEGVLGQIPKVMDMQVKLAKELVDIRYRTGISSDRYRECLLEMLQGLRFENDIPLEENRQAYEEGYAKYYEPFMAEHSYILENYLVNYVFKNLAPTDKETPFESYASMVLHYVLIKLHLVGIAKKNEGLTEEQIVKCIQSMSKTFEHNKTYFTDILRLVKENNYMTLANMAILIKN